VTFAPPYSDGLGSTWGLKATNVIQDSPSAWTGKGIRIAILDTGVDLAHPDLAGRVAAARSFVRDHPVQDSIGHGTHCAGTTVGFKDARNYRYGIAFNAELYVARVFDDTGGARTDRVVAGIDWALSLGCHVISLPLGTFDSEPVEEFEAAGQRALASNCLVVAAAGNGRSRIVGPPASADSILAVGAVDNWLRLAPFSPGADDRSRGDVNLLAPGVNVYSAALDGTYSIRSGTSAATAHVAGIAALWAEAEGIRGRTLWERLVDQARPVVSIDSKVGPRLVTAP
jgi:subtilisin family serine protease